MWAQIEPHISGHGHVVCYNCFCDLCAEVGVETAWHLYQPVIVQIKVNADKHYVIGQELGVGHSPRPWLGDAVAKFQVRELQNINLLFGQNWERDILKN